MGKIFLSKIENKELTKQAREEIIMSNQVYTRKATFKQNEKGIYTPVNKRAKAVAKRAGKRTRVTLADLKKLKGTGTYTYWEYKGDKLKAIKV